MERDLIMLGGGLEVGIPSGSAYRLLHQARLTLRQAPGMVDLLTDLNTVKNLK